MSTAGRPEVGGARIVRVVPGGPVLVEGPVELVGHDGERVCSDRFMVAVCACRRSKNYPLCDTSHRRKERAADSRTDSPDAGGGGSAGGDASGSAGGDASGSAGGDASGSAGGSAGGRTGADGSAGSGAGSDAGGRTGTDG